MAMAMTALGTSRTGRGSKERGEWRLGFAGGRRRPNRRWGVADGYRVEDPTMDNVQTSTATGARERRGQRESWVGPALLPAGPSVHSVGFLVLLLSVFLSISLCFQLSFLSFIYY